MGIIKPIWTEVQVLCKSKECSVPTNMESTKAVTLAMFKVKGTVGGCHIAILPSIIIISITEKTMQNPAPCFQGIMKKKPREAAVTNKPPPHPQHILSLPSDVPRPCLLSHLYCTCGKFILCCSTAVSGDIYEKTPSFENNTSVPTAEQGSLARAAPGAEVASSFPCAEVGPSPFLFSPAAALSLCPQRQLCLQQLWWEKGPKG